MTLTLRLMMLATTTCLIAAPARAEQLELATVPRIEVDTATLNRDTITFSGGVGYLPSYEGSNNYIAVPVAVVRGRVMGFNFSTNGLQLSVDGVRNRKGSRLDVMFGPIIGLNVNRNARIVDPQVRALGKLNSALQFGGFVGIGKTGVLTSAYDKIALRVSYLRDISGVHNSYIISPSIEYGMPISRRAYLGMSASASFAGDGYAETYFAVDAAGSLASGLPVFARPRGGVKSYTGSVVGNYALTGDLLRGLQLFTVISYSQLQGDFALSPITSIAGGADQFYGVLGIGYTF